MPKAYVSKQTAAGALRIAGSSYEEIARVLEYGSVRAAKSAALAAIAEGASDEMKRDHRNVANARLDQLLRSTMEVAVDVEHPAHLQYNKRAQDIISDIIRINGAAAPQEIVIHTPTTAQIMDWVASVGAADRPAVEEADVFAIEGEVVDEIDTASSSTQDVALTHEGPS